MKPAMPDSIELLEVKKLIPYARNSRTHNPDQVRQIAASIKEFGFTNPVLISETNDIIAGHGRTMAAELLGIDKVPCLRLGYLTPAQRKAYVIADNKLALNAGWDAELLGLEIGELREEGYDIDLLGFTEEELAALVVEELPEGLTDEDEVPDVPEEPISKEGDVWILGKHRLMCGDSTSIDAVEKLMDGKKADMVFTDPPYGMNKDIKNDGEEWAEVMMGAFNLCHEIPTQFWFCSSTPKLLKKAMEIVDPDRVIVWHKPFNLSHPQKGFAWHLEFCLYKTTEAPKNNKSDLIEMNTIWRKADPENVGHPTQKPTALFENLAAGFDAKIIIDLFGGSGSTLIACEKTARDCRMMELDPKYVDVIIRRWQDFTGQAAIHEETGKTFDEMSNG